MSKELDYHSRNSGHQQLSKAEIIELFEDIIEKLRESNPRREPAQFLRLRGAFTKNQLVFLFELEELFGELADPRKRAASAVGLLENSLKGIDESLEIETVRLIAYRIVRRKSRL